MITLRKSETISDQETLELPKWVQSKTFTYIPTAAIKDGPKSGYMRTLSVILKRKVPYFLSRRVYL